MLSRMNREERKSVKRLLSNDDFVLFAGFLRREFETMKHNLVICADDFKYLQGGARVLALVLEEIASTDKPDVTIGTE